MNISLLVTFVVLNAVNVIIQTIKSLVTVKCGKTAAAITNAIAYGLYTIVVVYMVCELPLWLKAIIIGTCNLICVYVVKFVEEKLRKDKLWKIECTVKFDNKEKFSDCLTNAKISFNALPCENQIDYIFNIYSSTQKQSKAIKEIAKMFSAKYFVSESKIL